MDTFVVLTEEHVVFIGLMQTKERYFNLEIEVREQVVRVIYYLTGGNCLQFGNDDYSTQFLDEMNYILEESIAEENILECMTWSKKGLTT